MKIYVYYIPKQKINRIMCYTEYDEGKMKFI